MTCLGSHGYKKRSWDLNSDPHMWPLVFTTESNWGQPGMGPTPYRKNPMLSVCNSGILAEELDFPEAWAT